MLFRVCVCVCCYCRGVARQLSDIHLPAIANRVDNRFHAKLFTFPRNRTIEKKINENNLVDTKNLFRMNNLFACNWITLQFCKLFIDRIDRAIIVRLCVQLLLMCRFSQEDSCCLIVCKINIKLNQKRNRYLHKPVIIDEVTFCQHVSDLLFMLMTYCTQRYFR